MDLPKIGFIILRHVHSNLTNQYWLYSYDSIRKHYPNFPILIIDDNSNTKYLTERELYNTKIINSEYPRRGEILPYYYYLHNRLFESAVILHDSVFINRPIDLSVDNYKLIWEFGHHCGHTVDERNMIKVFNDPDLVDFYNKKEKWKGCFGGMSIITHKFLCTIDDKYDISKLLPHITTRHSRCCFERVIACLLQKEHPKEVLLGDIHKYCPWGLSLIKRRNMISYLW